jgi:hypothetical protein
MLTVGVNLKHNEASPVAALPFIAATLLIAALPLLLFLLFRRRAQRLDASGARLDERQQLALEHPCVRCVHRAYPLSSGFLFTQMPSK